MKKPEQSQKSVGRIISYCISMLCLILCIFITVEVINSNRQQRPPRIFGLSVSYVPTASMEPTISAGEYVMYGKTNFEDVNVGDIIVYKSSSGMYIIHRVIEKNTEYLTTKGDNNAISDTEQITPDMVYGKYIMTIYFLSIFSGGISKNLVFLILILIFTAMIVMQIISIVLKQKTEKLKKDSEADRKLLLEQLKKEILEEELEKLKQSHKEDTKP